MVRCCYGIDDDRRFLPLNLVNRTDSGSGNAVLNFKNLGVVWSNDQDVIETDGSFLTLAINPLRTRA